MPEIRERSMVDGPDVTVDELLAFTPNDIVKAYSGKAERCCCGCAGIYKYPSAAAAGKFHADPEDVNEAWVKRVLTKIQKAAREGGKMMYGSNFASAEVGTRLYIVYPRAK